MKQTAVEWLFKNIWISPPEKLLEILDKAKEMEKQQIIDAVDSQRQLGCEKGEHYYNETFNK